MSASRKSNETFPGLVTESPSVEVVSLGASEETEASELALVSTATPESREFSVAVTGSMAVFIAASCAYI